MFQKGNKNDSDSEDEIVRPEDENPEFFRSQSVAGRPTLKFTQHIIAPKEDVNDILNNNEVESILKESPNINDQYIPNKEADPSAQPDPQHFAMQ